MKDYGKYHTKECKDNLLITNYNETLKTFNHVCFLIQCMFSEHSGSLKRRKPINDKGFLIVIQAKRYKEFFNTNSIIIVCFINEFDQLC